MITLITKMRRLIIMQEKPILWATQHSTLVTYANRLSEQMAQCCKPTQTWWSLNCHKENGVKFGDGAKEKTRWTVTNLTL